MTRTRRFAAILALALAACGTEDAIDADTGRDVGVDTLADDLTPEERIDATPPPDDFGDVPPAFQPREGVWSYQRGAVADNTCGVYAWADRDTPFRIPYSADGAFVVEQGDPWGDFACFVVGNTFECPRRGAGENPVVGTDVTIRYVVSIAGTVESDAAMRGTQRAEVECTGSQCALAPTVLGVSFPCGWTIPFEVTHVL